MSENPLSTSGGSLVDRAKSIILSPKEEWPKIAAEPGTVKDVFLKYAVPLAAIGPVAGLIGGQVFGLGGFGFSWKPSIGTALSMAIGSYVLSLVSLFIVAWIANFLSPKFGGQDSFEKAFKLCAYSFTAAWIVGIIGLIPSLGILGLLGLYSLYLLYVGATPMMGVPSDKAAGYTAVTVIAAIVLNLVAGAIIGAMAGPSIYGGAIAAGGDEMTVNIPGMGEMQITDEGDRQTIEVPGVGTVEVTQNGDTVTIDSEEFQGEFRAPAAD